MPRLRRGMDIRHMTLAQYRYFRDVGLGGQVPTSEVSPVFRGRAALRSRAAADLALCTGMRPEEWSTVLLPELGVGQRSVGASVTFAVRRARSTASTVRYTFRRERWIRSTPTCLWSAPRWCPRSKSLARRHQELFVVDRVDHPTGTLYGVLQGRRRTFTMSAMPPQLRRITVQDKGCGLESLGR